MADTLSITDNRTGKTYELPITEGVCAVLEGMPLNELAGSLMGRRPTDE